jgi:hypothetical protein
MGFKRNVALQIDLLVVLCLRQTQILLKKKCIAIVNLNSRVSTSRVQNFTPQLYLKEKFQSFLVANKKIHARINILPFAAEL